MSAGASGEAILSIPQGITRSAFDSIHWKDGWKIISTDTTSASNFWELGGGSSNSPLGTAWADSSGTSPIVVREVRVINRHDSDIEFYLTRSYYVSGGGGLQEQIERVTPDLIASPGETIVALSRPIVLPVSTYSLSKIRYNLITSHNNQSVGIHIEYHVLPLGTNGSTSVLGGSHYIDDEDVVFTKLLELGQSTNVGDNDIFSGSANYDWSFPSVRGINLGASAQNMKLKYHDSVNSKDYLVTASGNELSIPAESAVEVVYPHTVNQPATSNQSPVKWIAVHASGNTQVWTVTGERFGEGSS